MNTNLEIVYENPLTFPTVSFCNLNPKTMNYRSIDDLILLCVFDERPCEPSEFSTFNDNLYGTCFRYNFDKSNLKQSYFAGKLNGFTIELFADRSEAYAYFSKFIS